MILSNLKSIAEKNLNAAVVDYCIGIHVYFTDLQGRAVIDAAQIASLQPLHLIHETTTTTLAYGIYKTDLPEHDQLNVAFVDIGHASMQVCIVGFKNGQLKILAHSFGRSLGGRDFDEALHHFAAKFKEEYKIDVFQNARSSIRLRAACEKLKKMKAILRKDGYLAAISERPIDFTDDNKWIEMDGNAMTNFHLALADEVLSSIEEKKTAKEIWDHLTKLYEATSLHNKIFLKRKLYTLRMSKSTSVTEHLNTLNTLFSQLTSLSCKIVEQERAELLLQTTVLQEKNRCKNKENRQVNLQQAEALTTMRGRSTERGQSSSHKHGRSKSRSKKNLKCYNCGKKGHLKKDCWSLNKNSNPQGNTANTSDDRDALCCEASTTVEGGSLYSYNDHALEIVGVGTIKLKMYDGTIKVVRDVRHVKGLKKNLLSYGLLDNNASKIETRKGIMKVFRGALVVLKDENIAANLYMLKGETLLEAEASVASCSSDSVMLWHQKLGHMSEQGMKVLVEQKLLLGLAKVSLTLCEHCITSKQHRLKFNMSNSRGKSVLELVHSDVWQAPVTSLGGAKNKIKCFRTDNGVEYTSEEFDDFYRKECIKRQFTVANTPQQNGVAERMNRTLLERTRAMLRNASLEKSFWAEAVNTACYLVNRAPSTAIELKTPIEMWTGKPADYSNLHGYRLWDPTARKVITNRDFIFVEDKLQRKEDDDSAEKSETTQIYVEKEFEKGDSSEAEPTHDEQEPESSEAPTTRQLDRVRRRLNWHSDYVIEGPNKDHFEELKAQLAREFEMKDLGSTNKILGMQIHRDRSNRKIWLSQKNYLIKILSRFIMQDCKSISTPISINFKLSSSMSPSSEEERMKMSRVPYASAVGSLMFVMICTRPDIAQAVGVVSRYMANPCKEHWNTVKKILRYIKGTSNVALCYGGSNLLINGYVDSDYAGDLDKSKSTTGYVFKVVGGAVEEWTVDMQKIHTKDNIADFMTKAINADKFTWCRSSCGLSETCDFALSDSRLPQQISAPILQCVKRQLEKALADAKLAVEDVHMVEVVGSASRVPAILKILTEFYGKEPRRTMNASECVARGVLYNVQSLFPHLKFEISSSPINLYGFKVNESFPFPISLSWKGSASDPQNGGVEQQRLIFPKGNSIPSVKDVTFHKMSTFSVDVQYSDVSDLHNPAKISTYTQIGPFPTIRTERPKLKAKVRLNLHGIVSLESASLLEEEEVPVSKEPTKGDTDVNKQYAKGITDVGAVENGVPDSGDKPVQMEIDRH
ncbi:Heat shock 70 kDa protein 15 [Hibiscus syriacus]|uniref:Heat shock 70 kDa protein 15 n=1 Tax=Hibiscus syriacus TaxID=106335 RepID=A0A6A3BDT2_HIBSY|nr:Heat shock 70 kDa protein 15 [Hibiscus syriacus]